MSDKGIAMKAYESAEHALNKFCAENTRLVAIVKSGDYPVQIQFVPDPQGDMFGNDNVHDDGTVNEIVVTVGITTEIRNTMVFRTESKVFKKMITLAERVGLLYYQAYAEEMSKEGA
jgi:hypothetical protein